MTLPNFLLVWALEQRSQNPVLQQALDADGELELSPEVTGAFEDFLGAAQISLSFVSGGWSTDFVDFLYAPTVVPPTSVEPWNTLVMGAETIYSPFALGAFAETLVSILRREQDERPSCQAVAIVAAKVFYFGVGGSLDDFVNRMEGSGAVVKRLREETAGVRRGVVQCNLRA